MSRTIEISFARSAKPSDELSVLLAADGGRLGAAAQAVDPSGVLARAFRISGFRGKARATTEIVAAQGSPSDRIAVVGVGDPASPQPDGWARLGGAAAGQLGKARKATVFLDVPGIEIGAREAADFAFGMLLRAYSFDRYKTKKGEDDANGAAGKVAVTIVAAAATAAKKEFAAAQAVAEGVLLARDLVNEPANLLGPLEFAERARELGRLGVKVEILTEKEMKKLGMGALLGVAQGSVRPPRLAVMQWNGAPRNRRPVAFVGKGVVFDTGGNSMKPASGMEDMKGDMGGAAAVTGLMHALAARKATVNAIGVIGLVENMVDGNAQRPGDIVTSMSGQTIEVLNTDAEGRLVLADAIWYCIDRFKPAFAIDLATLTGAVMVALGQHHAGLFSNNDELAGRLLAAGLATQERVWRLPLGPEYDKLIDSKNADMKNIGGRYGGSITAAQFLQRFVKDTAWAHLDIAGTAMGSPATEISQGWASGFGVRLLDRLVRDNYEG
ncbi:MAG: leucyl aminopeptidase [Rhizobiales bacterium]|nr:leucyl aminopeptidase [Hyphomicrobiales bacterium]